MKRGDLIGRSILDVVKFPTHNGETHLALDDFEGVDWVRLGRLVGINYSPATYSVPTSIGDCAVIAVVAPEVNTQFADFCYCCDSTCFAVIFIVFRTTSSRSC